MNSNDNSTNSGAKKQRRWWVWPLSLPLGLLFCAFGFWFYISVTPSGQGFITRITSGLANKYLFHHATIGAVQISLPPRLTLHQLVVYDHRDSILFSAEALRLGLKWPVITQDAIYIDQLVLSEFTGNLRWYRGDAKYNYEMALKLPEKTQQTPSGRVVLVRKLILEAGNFSFADYNQAPFRKPGEQGMDFYRLGTNQIDGVFDSLRFDKGFSAHIAHLSLKERSGFTIRRLSAHMGLDSGRFHWDKLHVLTNRSNIHGQVRFDFKSWRYWKYFNDSIDILAHIDSSTVFADDIGFFAPEVNKVFAQVQLAGKAHGRLRAFRVEDLSVQAGTGTFIRGTIDFKGLPQIDETFIKAQIHESQLTLSDLTNQLPGNPLPAVVHKLGNMSFNGNFTGFVKSFVAQGQFVSNLGSAKTDLSVKLHGDPAENQYSGHLSLFHFDLGALLDRPQLGHVSLNASLNGWGSNLDNMRGNLDGTVTELGYMGYNYQNMSVSADLASRYFDGKLLSTDPNADLSVDGKIDFSASLPAIKVITEIKNLDLHALGLSKDSIRLRTEARMDFTGNQMENFVGNISTRNMWVYVNGTSYQTGKALVKSALTPKGKRWELESDFAQASLETSLLLMDLWPSLRQHGINWLPKDFGLEKKETTDYIDLNLTLSQPDILNSLLPKGYETRANTHLRLYIHDSAQIAKVAFNAPGITAAHIAMESPSVRLMVDNGGYESSIQFAKVEFGEFSLHPYSLELHSDSSGLHLSHSGMVNDTSIQFLLGHHIAYSTTPTSLITSNKSYIYAYGDTLSLGFDSIAWVGLDAFHFHNLSLGLGQELFTTTGNWAASQDYAASFNLQGLQLGRLSAILPDYFHDMEGLVNGNGLVHTENKLPVIEAGLTIDPLDFKGIEIERLTLESHYEQESKKLEIQGLLTGLNGDSLIGIDGWLEYGDQVQLDFYFDMDDVAIDLFSPLAQGVVSEMEGNTSMQVRLYGLAAQPNLSGWLALKQAKVHVDYMGTDYAFTDTIAIGTEQLSIEHLVLHDGKGGRAVVNGTVTHDRLSRFDLDLGLRCTNFESLRTLESDNDLYYGNILGTGTASFTGPLLRSRIACQITTQKGSKFVLPIEDEQGFSMESYIRFVDPNRQNEEYKVNDNDFSLDLNLVVTPETEMQLIFDKQLGDIIKAWGSGSITIGLSPAGELEIFGDYIIDNGNYLFTAFDLINKRFEIEKGSKISWVGDPYDALIDIRANYFLKANAYALASGLPQLDVTTLESYKTPMPVVAYANLKGSLLKPEIDLNFKFLDEGGPDAAPLMRALDNLQLGEDELTKQVVSLLVLNRFMPLYSAPTDNSELFGSSVGTSLGDLISNQLTYWLSSISDDIQVNLNYRNGFKSDGITLSEKELELALATTLFNDRVSVNFAYELQNEYSPLKEIAYKVNPDGSLKVLVFQRKTQNPVISFSSNTYGIGVFLKREFESVSDLFKKDDPKK